MNEKWIARQTATPEARRRYEQERLVLWTTEAIYEAMEDAGLSKADLARELGTSRANITALLSGSRNMTLRTVSDLAFILGMRAGISLEPLRGGQFVSTPMTVVSPFKRCVVQDMTSPHTGPAKIGSGRSDFDVPGDGLAA